MKMGYTNRLAAALPLGLLSLLGCSIGGVVGRILVPARARLRGFVGLMVIVVVKAVVEVVVMVVVVVVLRRIRLIDGHIVGHASPTRGLIRDDCRPYCGKRPRMTKWKL